MRFSMLLVGVAGLVAVACGSDDDNGGGDGAAGSSSKAGSSSSAGTSSTAGSGNSSGSGGGSSGPGKVIDVNAPDDTPANELSDAQVDAFCKSVGEAAQAAFGNDFAEAMCSFTGYFLTLQSGGDKAACEMVENECLADPEEPADEECTKPGPTCTATVGEIEKCMNDQLARVEELLAQLPGCDEAGTEVDFSGFDMETPESCAVVEEKCPEVLDNAPDSDVGFGG